MQLQRGVHVPDVLPAHWIHVLYVRSGGHRAVGLAEHRRMHPAPAGQHQEQTTGEWYTYMHSRIKFIRRRRPPLQRSLPSRCVVCDADIGESNFHGQDWLGARPRLNYAGELTTRSRIICVYVGLRVDGQRAIYQRDLAPRNVIN